MMRSGFERGDPLEVEVVALSDHGGLARSPTILDPRPDAEGTFTEPVVDADRQTANTERDDRLVIAQPDRHDPFGRGGDLGRAVLVLDRDGKRLAGRRRRGRRTGCASVVIAATAGDEE